MTKLKISHGNNGQYSGEHFRVYDFVGISFICLSVYVQGLIYGVVSHKIDTSAFERAAFYTFAWHELVCVWLLPLVLQRNDDDDYDGAYGATKRARNQRAYGLMSDIKP